MKMEMRVNTFQGLEKHKDITTPGARFYNDPVAFAVDRFAYYQCFKCRVRCTEPLLRCRCASCYILIISFGIWIVLIDGSNPISVAIMRVLQRVDTLIRQSSFAERVPLSLDKVCYHPGFCSINWDALHSA